MVKLNKKILNLIDMNLNKFIYTEENFKKIENIKKNDKYNIFVMKVIINNNIAISNDLEGDTRKKIILDFINDSLSFCKTKYKKNIKYSLFYIYVADVHSYEYPDLPFWVIARPQNENGILFPDNTFKCHKINNTCYNWDETKKIIYDKCKNINKINKIYFKGANTGSDKHNIRKLLELYSKNSEIPIEIILNKPMEPIYNFCKYKYLLNLGGHQPWSYRFKYLFLMKSLVINIAIKQDYNIIKTDKWINFYDNYFTVYEDYIEVEYIWKEKGDNTQSYKKLLNDLENIYYYFEKNPKEYNTIVNNGYNKAKSLTQDIVYLTQFTLIEKYNKKNNF